MKFVGWISLFISALGIWNFVIAPETMSPTSWIMIVGFFLLGVLVLIVGGWKEGNKDVELGEAYKIVAGKSKDLMGSLKNKKPIIIGVLAVFILGGGYWFLLRPTIEAKDRCARNVIFRPASSYEGEYYTTWSTDQKFRTFEEAVSQCVRAWQQSR